MSLFMIAKNTKYYLAIGILTVANSMPANALTLKKGQVIGGDGNVYDGASPQAKVALLLQVKENGKFAKTLKAITARNFFNLDVM